ncbi:glycosyltransferase family 2 protein [Kosakonia sp.]|uniref:glycosyltransferase family 2 protein n=1 Tax=Kosakonia sp. TaxID=1916651 RepID=UPI00289852BA|nr:glycosyltransferase family 2 protein [Kosakonia sp.]
MKVSFCIPTYNRAVYLELLLQSIKTQQAHSLDLEICIADNASTDSTEELIPVWEEKFGIPIRYKKHANNIGPDRNYLAAIDLATGDYCWIFGSDDMLRSDALVSIENELNKSFDIYLCDRRELDITMSTVKNAHRKWLSKGTKEYVFNNDDDRIEYFNDCESVGGVFSYLSSIIVRRAAWQEIAFDESFIGTAYPHVYILLKIIQVQGSSLSYLSEPLALCRGDNDTFESAGKAKRVLIDYAGYFKLSDALYHNKPLVKEKFESILSRERPYIYTTLMIASYANAKERDKFAFYQQRLGHQKLMTNLLFILGPIATALKKSPLLKKITKKILK